jgi:hypothetical protein
MLDLSIAPVCAGCKPVPAQPVMQTQFQKVCMRVRYLVPCLLFSMAAFAQQGPSGQAAANDNPAAGGGPITVEGCVTSVNGHFSLATRSGMFRLKGDHDSLFGHDGQQVRVTGTVTPGKKKAQTLKISEIKKLSDTCQ